jgi:hypothetical protein
MLTQAQYNCLCAYVRDGYDRDAAEKALPDLLESFEALYEMADRFCMSGSPAVTYTDYRVMYDDDGEARVALAKNGLCPPTCDRTRRLTVLAAQQREGAEAAE